MVQWKKAKKDVEPYRIEDDIHTHYIDLGVISSRLANLQAKVLRAMKEIEDSNGY